MARSRTINQAIVKPETVAGCEKVPLGAVVAAGILFGMVGWWFWSIPAALTSALCFGVGLPIVRRMGKADPMLCSVYAANIWFRAYYPGRTPAHIVEPDENHRQPAAGWVGTVGIALIAAGWLLGSVTLSGVGVLALVVGIPLARRASRPQ